MILNQIDSTTGAAASATATSSSSSSQSAGLSSAANLNENDFLNMLITELKNQDPTNPLQSTDLAAQLAQFSQVSELQTMNTNIQNATNANLVLTQSINNTMAATLIGKQIKANSSTIVYDGTALPSVGVTLNGNAADVKVQIKDSAGNVVRTIDAGPKLAGDNTISWDGKDDSGNSLQAGDYTFSVSATDSAGNSVSTSSYSLGVVQGVKYSSSGTVLIVNGEEINLSDVEEIFGSGN
ncbi:MAG TPA: FlgD immunoglobulin-like domain containing protein [Candidatus Acidoferrales bacterium]|nr:FlgD immunoglobulin-like domain containing protein [Candidatus Acidoferrales bacterium]